MKASQILLLIVFDCCLYAELFIGYCDVDCAEILSFILFAVKVYLVNDLRLIAII